MKQNPLPKHKKLNIVPLLIILAAAFILCDIAVSKYHLTITEYERTSPKIDTAIRIVHLTDLHNNELGKENERLVRVVEGMDPDLVCITGDLLDLHSSDADTAINLVEDLAENFPVYISYGNHEVQYSYMDQTELRRMLEEAGAVVLDFDYEDITLNGTTVRVGGFYGYGFPAGYEVEREDESAFLSRFQDTDSYKILLAHMPFAWYRVGSLDAWDVDLVFCGHTHGGQVRLPRIGGLYAPEVGWFPGRERGIYDSEDGESFMVLSRGLGSAEGVPRFNNPPELVVLDLLPES